MVWTRFMDMHSGGGQKLDWSKIYIEASEEDAAKVFMHRFGRNPNNITCSCCGEDYSFYGSSKTLQQASGFDRHCEFVGDEYIEHADKWGKFIPFETWLLDEGKPGDDRDSFLVIRKEDINPGELVGETPRRGHLVWVED